MADRIIQTETLTGIANAIRSKTGGSESITVSDMAEAIENIPSGGGGDIDALIDGSSSGVIRSNVTSVRDYGFYGCNGITELYLPNVTEMGEYSLLDGLSSLEIVEIPNITEFPDTNSPFSDNENLTTAIFTSLQTLPERYFYGCSNLVNGNFSSVTSIGDEAFSGCSNLVNGNFSSVTSIGNEAFSGCSNLVNGNFSSVTDIGFDVFSGCSSIIHIYLPRLLYLNSSITDCENLAIVEFEDITAIPDNSFSACPSLSTIILRGLEVCSIERYDNYIFYDTEFGFSGNGGTVYVPQALLSEYMSDENWAELLGQNENNQILPIEGSIYDTSNQ